ncbi:MAG: hypothetical protein IJ087_15475 [Eggerthellaceae bacterium]|nr:hypothetical protein [Eggerthellaceae bacterium]
MSTQAKTVKMFVMVAQNGEKLTYKNGLIAKSSSSRQTTKYTYSGKKVKAIECNNGGRLFTDRVAYDNKGRISKVVTTSSLQSSNATRKYAYNSKGQVSRVKTVYADGSGSSTVRYFYDSKGRVSKTVGEVGSTKWTYDKKGYLASTNTTPPKGVTGAGRYWGYTNHYDKNGNIASREVVTQGIGSAYTETYKYKKISVPKTYAAMAKKQQEALFNRNPAVLV